MAAALSSWRWPWFFVTQGVSPWALLSLWEMAAHGCWVLGTESSSTPGLFPKVLAISYTDENISLHSYFCGSEGFGFP